MSDWYPSESTRPPDDVDESDDRASESEPEPPVREGLPDNYAMRHDRHYVDELLRGSDDASRKPSRKSTRAVLPPGTAPPLTPILSEVANGLDAALACW